MRWTRLVASATIAGSLWLPSEAAQPGAPTAETATEAPITFERYRDWRINFNKRRRSELAADLAATDLPAARKARLLAIEAYYDRLAALPDAERDRLFRARFERIDINHDGTIDQAERAAWRDKQRDFYRRDRTNGPQHAAAVTQ